jgi:hypothetical protein
MTRIEVEEKPHLAARFRIDEVPTLLVVEDNRVRKRIVKPSGGHDLRAALAPWLR